MTIDRSYVAENNAQRARLRVLVGRMSDGDLAQPMPAGWTVAAVLGHLAFWDQRILALLEASERGVLPAPLDEKHVDWINDAGKPFLLALPPRKLAELAVAIAEAVDAKVAALSDDFVTRNAKTGKLVNLARAEHRKEHLDEIERLL